MKNIFLLPTKKESRLVKGETTGRLLLHENYGTSTDRNETQHSYITSDEKIKKGDWCLHKDGNGVICKVTLIFEDGDVLLNNATRTNSLNFRKIILTTDQDLTTDGVQAIDDEFLEWFVKNPSFEYLEVKKDNHLFCKHCNELHSTIGDGINCDVCRKESQPYLKTLRYKTIIPKEESKKETLEEAAERLYPTTINSFTDSGFDMSETERLIFINGANWQAERMYSEEEVLQILKDYDKGNRKLRQLKLGNSLDVNDWFENYKEFKNK